MSEFLPKSKAGLPALKIVSLACALACSAYAHAQANDGVRLRTAGALSDSSQVVNDNSASFVSADHMETTDDQIILKGDAEGRADGFYAEEKLSVEEAVGLIVNGYAREVMNKLPMEFAVEAQKLLTISLEGSVG